MFGLFFAKALTGFIVPAITAGVMNAIAGVGISGTMTVQNVVTSFLTGLAVYLVPNAKK